MFPKANLNLKDFIFKKILQQEKLMNLFLHDVFKVCEIVTKNQF